MPCARAAHLRSVAHTNTHTSARAAGSGRGARRRAREARRREGAAAPTPWATVNGGCWARRPAGGGGWGGGTCKASDGTREVLLTSAWVARP